MKIAVTITRPERVSYEKISDVAYTKIFDENDTLSSIMMWAETIRQNSHQGPLKADITDLCFSHVCE